MEFWSLDNVKSILGGSWLARPDPEARRAPDALSTDTRTLRPGQAFLAIRGETFDGHDYLAQAGAAGAVLAIVDRPPAGAGALPHAMSVLQVPDTGRALVQLAAAYRRTLETTKVVAVGGSNGKTTTTRLIAHVLASVLRGRSSPKSFNNAVGVPLTILSARRGDQYLVCEVGTNAPGEIAPLASCAQPDVAVITSIGREHLEGLGSAEGVLAEEVSLLDGLRPGGVAVMTADCPALTQRVMGDKTRNAGRSVVRFGFASDADLRITACESGDSETRFCLNGRSWYTLALPGRHNASNAAAAIAVARRLGVDDDSIRAALASARGAEMRMERVQAGGVEFLNDAYNANPDSMLAALRAFDDCFPRASGSGRRVLVVGDMLELGSAGPDAHREIGDAIGEMDVDLAVFVGELSAHAVARLARRWPATRYAHVPQADEPGMARVASMLRAGDRVLLKASRRIALERVAVIAGRAMASVGAA
jgi:UDP-N-acetylmuramoyl-tripeptide--D-alanyl-D-alanine ligase